MSETKTQPHILSADQMKDAMNTMYGTLNLIVAINNKFVEEMGKSKTLGEEDAKRIEQWSRAVAKAHERVPAMLRATDRPPASTKAN